MKDFRQRAFVGLIGLVSAGLLSVGCSSSSNNTTTGSGGSNGSGTGGSHTGGTTGSGGSSTGSGGSTGGGGATAGCTTSDPAASATIADFSGDAGVEATGGGLFVYPGSIAAPGQGAPTAVVTGGALHVTDTVAPAAMAQYVGVGIYFSGNVGGTDCTDAHTYTGVQFDIKGSLTGGCTLQYSTNDSEHAAVSTSDPKAGGATGSYAPQAQIASDVTSAGSTVKVAFTDSTLGTGSPATPIDPTKLEGVQWQLTVPAATAVGDGGSASCVLDMTIDNVKFY